MRWPKTLLPDPTNWRVTFDTRAKSSTVVALKDKLTKQSKLQEGIYNISEISQIRQCPYQHKLQNCIGQISVQQCDTDKQWTVHKITNKIRVISLANSNKWNWMYPNLATMCCKEVYHTGRHVSSSSQSAVSPLLCTWPAVYSRSNRRIMELHARVIDLLRSGRFKLGKWCSSGPDCACSSSKKYAPDKTTFASLHRQ